MMHIPSTSILAAVLIPAASFLLAGEPSFRVNVTNQLDRARPAETVELPVALLRAAFRAEDLPRVHVTAAGGAHEELTQAVDLDGDGAFDQVVFQTGFEPRATRTFVLTLGGRTTPRKEDFRVYGRFVRERFDDFAWENDRVAHRVYGLALETWEKEPLTSSGIDVWVKRTQALVVNDWYMVDDYHQDHGEGGDFYSVGPSRGCGGTGVFKDGHLFVSRNFRSSRVLANGPIRLVFELQYPPWVAGAAQVSETKRVVLDASSHFNRIESVVTVNGSNDTTWAVGIKKAKGAEIRSARELGILRTWESLKEPNGSLGCAIVIDPAHIRSLAEVDGNVLFVVAPDGPGPITYFAGSAWDRGGDVSSVAIWDNMIEDQAHRWRSPLKIELVTP